MHVLDRIRQWRIAQMDRRVLELTEAIEGTSRDLWPEHVADMEYERRRLFIKRSELILKGGTHA